MKQVAQKSSQSRSVLEVPRVLKTERLLLRCPRPEDGLALHAAILESKERLWPWFAWIRSAELTLERSMASARLAQWRFWGKRELQYFLFLRKSRQFIGVCGLCRPAWEVPQFELSYWLRTGCENKGYMTEAATAVFDLAWGKLGARRVEIRCEAGNQSSRDLAARLGFRQESRAADAVRPGEEVIFSRTR